MNTEYRLSRIIRGLLFGGALLLLSSAAWATTYTVTSLDGGDTVPGSLRYIVENNALGGDTINFSSLLNGQSINLQDKITLNSNVTIDASGLTNGVTIMTNKSISLIFVDGVPDVTVLLKGLTLSGGRANYGGAVLNDFGTVTLTQCTLSGNSSASEGGAIDNELGNVTLNQCTLSGNSSGNPPGSAGGAINNQQGNVTLNQCTLSGNSSGGYGGAIFNKGSLTLTNSVVANNTAVRAGSNDILNSGGSISLVGANWVGNLSGTNLTASSTLFTGDPMLAPLGNYGGLTQTMMPQGGSPVINQSVGSTFTTDQRGLAITDSKPDLGATELIFTTVTTNADSGTGSLRDALTSATSGSAINFDPSLDAGTISLLSEIDINCTVFVDATGLLHGLTVQGGGASGSYRLLTVNAGSVSIKGITFTGGGGSGFSDSGAAISSARGTTLTLAQCTFTSNKAPDVDAGGGGAIYTQGALTASQCAFTNNSTAGFVASGGAIVFGGPTLSLTQCTFSGNSSQQGGCALHQLPRHRDAQPVHSRGQCLDGVGRCDLGKRRHVDTEPVHNRRQFRR